MGRAPPARARTGPTLRIAADAAASASAANARARRSRCASRVTSTHSSSRPRQQLAAAQRERVLVLSRPEQTAERIGVDPHLDSPRAQRAREQRSARGPRRVQARGERPTMRCAGSPGRSTPAHRATIAQRPPSASGRRGAARASRATPRRDDPRGGEASSPSTSSANAPSTRIRTIVAKRNRSQRRTSILRGDCAPIACVSADAVKACADPTRGAGMTVHTAFNLDAFQPRRRPSPAGLGVATRVLPRGRRVDQDRPAHAAELAAVLRGRDAVDRGATAASPIAGSRRPWSMGCSPVIVVRSRSAANTRKAGSSARTR